MAGALDRTPRHAGKIIGQPVYQLDGELDELKRRARSWLFEEALPWWAANTWDEANGGIVEAFDFDGRDAVLPIKRTRVACRQIYVFSHAHILGWPHGLDVAARCINHLTDQMWAGPERGFPKLTTRTGDIADATIDLYDHAFALFGFAWHARATGSQHSIDWTYRTLDFIENQLRHPTQPGFVHQLPRAQGRLQNPHMHLTEACLSAFEATGDNRFRAVARELVDLLCDHFFDSSSGALHETFSDDLQRINCPDGGIVEPGHQFEWSWILNAMRGHLARDVTGEIRMLHEFAERWGVDRDSGAVRDAIRTDGTQIAGGSRTWPNAERLRSAIALNDLDRVDVEPIIRQTMKVLFGRYLATDRPGLWCDAFDDAGRPTATNVPTSTLYHIFGAFAELLRFDP